MVLRSQGVCLVTVLIESACLNERQLTLLIGALSVFLECLNVSSLAIVNRCEPAETRKRAEYGFGEYGFKHRTQ